MEKELVFEVLGEGRSLRIESKYKGGNNGFRLFPQSQ